MTTLLHPSFYAIVTFKGEYCIARCHNRHWEFDETSNSINEMLQNGLIDLDAVQCWIDTHSRLPQSE